MLSKKGYILSLGGGANQLPFLEASKKAGYKVITVDKNTLSPGFAFSDLKIVESITEYRKIYSILLQTILDAPLVGVGCRSYGKATTSLAYLSEKLDLPGSPLESIKKFSNKATFNRFLKENRIPTPTQLSSSKSADAFEYPIIAKPALGDGKKGILKIHSKKEFKSLQNSFSSGIYLEEFIEGREFTVLGFVQNKKFHLVSVSDKITTEYPPFLELAHILPCSARDLVGEFKFYCQKIAIATGLVNSPLVAEFKVDRRKNIFLIEAVPEIGGEFLAEKLVLQHFGYDYFADYVRLISGQDIQLYNKKKKIRKETTIRFLAPPSGKHRILELQDTNSSFRSQVFFERTLKQVGEIVDSSSGNSARVHVSGYFSPVNTQEIQPTKNIFKEVLFEPIED